jgi:hypothetical protein
LCANATEDAAKIAICGCKTSNDWQHCVKRRHIICGTACSEVGEVNEENVDYLINKSLHPRNNTRV